MKQHCIRSILARHEPSAPQHSFPTQSCLSHPFVFPKKPKFPHLSPVTRLCCASTGVHRNCLPFGRSCPLSLMLSISLALYTYIEISIFFISFSVSVRG